MQNKIFSYPTNYYTESITVAKILHIINRMSKCFFVYNEMNKKRVFFFATLLYFDSYNNIKKFCVKGDVSNY